MADLCDRCGQPSEDGGQPLKVLPCGHTACVPCIGEQPATEGRRCPVCGKALCYFDALPDEMLEQVLARVPAGRFGGGLLRLRQVCRRWRRLVEGSAALWRHLRLRLELANNGRDVWGSSALACAPAVGCVEVSVPPNHYPARIRSLVQALECSRAKVLAVHLTIPATQAMAYASRALNAVQHSLRELDLYMTCNGVCSSSPVMAASVGRLTELTSLKISKKTGYGHARFGNGGVRPIPKLNWDLRSLTKLQRLTVGTELSGAMVRGLLEASKASLLEVDFGDQEVHEALAGCTALRAVTVRTATATREPGSLTTTSQSLAHLKRVRTLETVTFAIQASVSLPAVANFLARSPDVPKAIKLSVSDFSPSCTLQTVLPSLGDRVRVLHLSNNLGMSERSLAQCLNQLTWLEALYLREVVLCHPNTDTYHMDWERGAKLVDWAERQVLAADLKTLHVHGAAVELDDEHLTKLGELRPGLRVCFVAHDKDCVGSNPFSVETERGMDGLQDFLCNS